MLKKYKLLVLLLLINSSRVYSQEGDFFGKFYTDVKAPSSPAFTILGTNPSEISRPKSYRQLELALLNNFFNQDGLSIPKDFSLEFSPYWLKDRPLVTFEDIYDPTPAKSALYNLSISLATQQSNQSDTTYISLGLRTIFDFGKPRKIVEGIDAIGDFEQNAMGILAINASYKSVIANDFSNFSGTDEEVNRLEKKLKEFIGLSQIDQKSKDLALSLVPAYIARVKAEKVNTKAGLDTQVNAIFDQNDFQKIIENMTIASKKIQGSLEDRVGFKIELAAAFRNEFRNNTFSDNTSPTAGFWITPSYLHENLPIEFLGAFRYIRDNQDFVDGANNIDWTSNLDVGLKLIYHVNKFSLEGEFIYRTQTQVLEAQDQGNGFTTRPERKTIDRKFDISLAYQFSENLAISYTYGKNFDLPILQGDLISALNLNFGIGGYKTSDK